MNRRESTLALAGLIALPPAAQTRQSMTHRAINATGSAYAHAHEITNPQRLLFVSGQVPEDKDGKVPVDFKSQCRMVWRNIEAQLHDAGMRFEHLVKVTVFLSDRRYRTENYEVRKEMLGELSPALTIIITGIYDEGWLLEIEAIAAA
jgi:2-iminobutanoate/2-iminopropanoate deaminase